MPNTSDDSGDVQYESARSKLFSKIEGDDLIDLTRILHVLRQRKNIVLAVAAFCFSMSFLYAMLATKIYSANSTVEMHSRRPRIVSGEGAVLQDSSAGSAGSADALNTQFYKMQSRTVRDRVAVELRKISEQYPLLRQFSTEEMDRFIANNVKFKRVVGTYLVEIRTESDSPDFAAEFVNIFARTALDSVKDSTKKASLSAVEWLQEQVDAYEAELLNNEAKVISFQQKHNTEVLNRERTTSEQSLLDINTQLTTYEIQSTILVDMVNTLNNITASPESCGILPSTIPRAEIIQTRLKDYTDALGTQQALLDKYTPKHPSVESQVRLLETLKSDLEIEIDRAKQTAKADLALADAYIASLKKQKSGNIEATEKIMQSINKVSTDMIPLTRAMQVSNSSYDGLLNRIEQARLASDEETSLLSVYEFANVPEKPIKPQRKIVLSFGLVVGLLAGIVLALLINTLQDRISSLYDLEVELGQNVLGVVPFVRDGGVTKEMARVTMEDKFGMMTEAMAGLRSALLAQRRPATSDAWVILLTSVSPAEGKSTISCNLAITMSNTNKKVLLIDGDMRKPRLHEVFEIPEKQQTLMEVLADSKSDDKAFAALPHQTAEIENLHVTLGHPMEGVSPTEILETGTFERFMAWARHNYDIVIVDSPPLGILSDALVFSRAADDVVFVCRSDKTKKGAMKHAIKEMDKNNCPLAGIVLNGYDPRSSGMNAGQYGGYHNYYGGYGHYAEAAAKSEGKS